MVELEQSREELKERGLGLAAISYDSVATLKHFADRKGIHFPLLSDEDSSVIRAFGILNKEVPETSEFFGVPHPVTYIVGADGRVQSRVFEEDYRRRVTAGSVIGARVSETEVPAKRIKIRQSQTDAVVHGGQRFKIRLDIELPPNHHVYAPGVQGYIPLDWKINSSSAFEAAPAAYPQARSLHLKAINETVPVYEGKLILEREIVPAQRLPAQELKIEGTLRYQVCDDRKCYVPESAPLLWTVKLEPHDTTRVPEELRRKRR